MLSSKLYLPVCQPIQAESMPEDVQQSSVGDMIFRVTAWGWAECSRGNIISCLNYGELDDTSAAHALFSADHP